LLAQTPTIQANEALINGSADCQRLALLNFFKTTRQQDEGLPIKKPVDTSAFLGKLDFKLDAANDLGISYNFSRSRKENETFDVPTYGTSANGIEGTGKIHAVNINLFTTFLCNKAERVPLHLLARRPPAFGDQVEHSCGHGNGLCDDVSFRQPILHATGR
jgi:hypothetical protein